MYRAIKSVPPVDPSAFKASVIPIPYKNPPNNTFRTRSSKKGVKEKIFKVDKKELFWIDFSIQQIYILCNNLFSS